MSLACKMSDKCTVQKGMCIHEKWMVAIIVLAAIAVGGSYYFHWY